MNWTKEQKAAIEKRDADLLVSAAAGSGKTAVLSSRIVSLLTDPVHPTDIDRILVVTFTNAAASEMRERIGKRIMEAREANPLNQHLKKQSTLLHNAMITTIDSFCLYVLRNYGNRIGFPPGFSVADPGECSLLAEDVMEQLVAEVFEEKDPEKIGFFEAYRSSRSISPVKDLIRRTAEFSESFPWPEQWFSSCLRDAAHPEELFESTLVKTVREALRKELEGFAGELDRCLLICMEPDGPEGYAETIRQDAEEFRHAAACADEWTVLSSEVQGLMSASLKPLRKYEGDPLKKELVQGTRNEIKKEINKLKDCYFSASAEEHIRTAAASARHVRALIGMTRRFCELFSEKKREKNVVDFSDIEHLALQILVSPDTGEPSEVAKLLSDRFDEIMIDEYQDSNLVQETILSSVAEKEPGRHNRFMVGDVKQSIYRFRQARPELFMEKYATYGEEGKEQKITLHQNFRSRRELLDAANHIFYRLMGEDVGGIDYDEAQALSCGASFPSLPDGEPCFSIRLMEEDSESKELLASEGFTNPELLLLVDTIRSLMEKKRVTDENGEGLRKLRYSDIAVLLRSPGSVGEEMQKVLRDAGIPAILPLRTGFFSTQEIRVLLNLLRIIDNPEQDIPLVSVMRSEIGRFTESDLAEIRLESGEEKGPFYRCVQKSKRAEDFLRWLSGYRELASWMPVAELLQKILDDTGYLEKLAAMPAGEQRLANARMLLEKAVTYGKTSFHGLFRFVRYIENLEKYEEDFGEAELLNEDMDAVRILSIHKSKGLEFPVVILYGSGREMNRRDTTDRLLLSPDHGIGLMYVDAEMRTKQSTLQRDAISRLLLRDSVGEEIRVLYVALTRAKEALVITGTKKKLSESIEFCRLLGEGKENAPISAGKRLGAGCYLDLLLPAVLLGEEAYEPEIVTAQELLDREKAFDKTEPSSRTIRESETKDREKPFHYPYSGEELIRDKISVSEWKQRIAEEEGLLLPELTDREEEPIPSFAKESKEGAADRSLRGSAFHRAMECFDFAEVPYLLTLEGKERIPYLRRLLLGLQESGKLTKEYYELLDLTEILAFLTSPLAMRLQEAEKNGLLYREKPFVLGIPAGRVYGGGSTETVITQGIIDVFFREGEKIVILDYKTDRVKSEDELKSKYKIQLDIYEEAVRRITGCKETEKLLYSFTLQRTIVV